MMKYFSYSIFGLCAVLLLPALVFGQTLQVGSAVQMQTTEQGAVVFTYSLPEASPLTLAISCANNENRFFVEDTGVVVACGETYDIPKPKIGGKVHIAPYDVKSDTSVTYTLSRTTPLGESEVVATQTMTIFQTVPAPLFTNVTVRQEDPKKPEVTVSWQTLESATMSLVVGCDLSSLVLVDPQGKRYSCNERILLAENADEGSVVLKAENTTLTEGLLFTFVAERDGKIGALKNISFTFETTTEAVGTGETDRGVIAHLIAQVRALLAVVAGLFR